MTEIRTDPLRGHRVALTPGREFRPRPRRKVAKPREPGRCPFCPGHEADTPPEVAAWGRGQGAPDSPGWAVRVIPNLYPAFGTHEVVIETPDHDRDWAEMAPARMRLVLDAWKARLAHHQGEPGIGHVQLFKNHGVDAGATRAHPHSQIVALPEVPATLARERHVFETMGSGGCPVCREIQTPDGERLLEADDAWVVLAPFAPRGPHELWIVPRDHHPGYLAETAGALDALADLVGRTRRRQRAVAGVSAYNMSLVSNEAPGAPGHWRLELLPRTTPLAGFELVTGMYLNEVSPEESIRRLLEAASKEPN